MCVGSGLLFALEEPAEPVADSRAKLLLVSKLGRSRPERDPLAALAHDEVGSFAFPTLGRVDHCVGHLSPAARTSNLVCYCVSHDRSFLYAGRTGYDVAGLGQPLAARALQTAKLHRTSPPPNRDHARTARRRRDCVVACPARATTQPVLDPRLSTAPHWEESQAPLLPVLYSLCALRAMCSRTRPANASACAPSRKPATADFLSPTENWNPPRGRIAKSAGWRRHPQLVAEAHQSVVATSLTYTQGVLYCVGS